METEKQSEIKKKIRDDFGAYINGILISMGLSEISPVVISAAFFGDQNIGAPRFIKSMGLRNSNAFLVFKALELISIESFIVDNKITGEYLPWVMKRTEIFVRVKNEFTHATSDMLGPDMINEEIRSFCASHPNEIRQLYDFVSEDEQILDIGKTLDQRLTRRFLNDWDNTKLDKLTFDQFSSLWFDSDLVPALSVCHKKGKEISSIFR